MSVMSERRRTILGVTAVVVLCGSAYYAWSEMRSESPGGIANERVFKCADCDAEFPQTLTLDNPEPVTCPKCGHKSGWAPEKCLCTGADTPTLVILKSRMSDDPDNAEQTYCPKCNREVVGHNVLKWIDDKAADREGRTKTRSSENNSSFD